MQQISIFLLSTIFLLASCDPGQELIIKASGKKGVSVIIYANTNILPNSDSTKNKKLIIRVPSTDTSTDFEQRFLYRIGGWSDGAVSNLAKNFDSIIFNNNAGKLILNDSTIIKNYLIKSRTGYANNALIIEAN